MKLVFVVLCMIFLIIAGFEYGKDPVRRFCSYEALDIYDDYINRTSKNTLENKYTNWNKYCPYENRVTIECSDGKINPNAIIEIWDYDNWPLGDDFLARFNWTKIADDGKSGYVDAFLGTDKLTDIYGSIECELFWRFDYPCSDGRTFKEANISRWTDAFAVQLNNSNKELIGTRLQLNPKEADLYARRTAEQYYL